MEAIRKKLERKIWIEQNEPFLSVELA